MIPAALMISDSLRSRAYLQMLTHHELAPPEVVLLQSRHKGPEKIPFHPAARAELEVILKHPLPFDPFEEEVTTCRRLGLTPQILEISDFNHPAVVQATANLCGSTVLISPAGILRQNLLNCGKRFLHMHPGRLPTYRGSTTFYYSLLEAGELSCSAFFMSKDLDGGPVCYTKHLECVKTTVDIDSLLDPLLRAVTLIELFKKNPDLHPVDATKDEGNEFFIIHPVLKHKAILKTRDRRRNIR